MPPRIFGRTVCHLEIRYESAASWRRWDPRGCESFSDRACRADLVVPGGHGQVVVACLGVWKDEASARREAPAAAARWLEEERAWLLA